jgi:superfamily II DNA/RNA helicase
VVLAPTRELCVQIAEQFQALGAGISLEVAVIVGTRIFIPNLPVAFMSTF